MPYETHSKEETLCMYILLIKISLDFQKAWLVFKMSHVVNKDSKSDDSADQGPQKLFS